MIHSVEAIFGYLLAFPTIHTRLIRGLILHRSTLRKWTCCLLESISFPAIISGFRSGKLGTLYSSKKSLGYLLGSRLLPRAASSVPTLFRCHEPFLISKFHRHVTAKR